MASDPHTQLLILALLLYPPLKQASTSVAALRRLREMTADDLAHLVRAGFPKVNVTLDNGSIDHGLRMIRDRRDRDSRLDHFISHGATTALLRQLFRLPVAEIKARRAALLGEHRQRRPQMPPPRERDAIHAAWWALRGLALNSM